MRWFILGPAITIIVGFSIACRDETLDPISGDKPRDLQSDTDTDTDADGDSDADSDGDTNTDTVVSAAAFCHNLVFEEGVPEIFSLVLGEGADQVILLAETDRCAAGIGGDCTDIPSGDAVPVKLLSNMGYVYYSEEQTLLAGQKYLFLPEVDVDGTVTMPVRRITLAGACGIQECIAGYYNENTCGPSDPCAWADDGACDEECLNHVSEMFDDSADCGSLDTDTDTDNDSASGIFCHEIETAAGDRQVLHLWVDNGIEAVQLDATSYGCSGDFGDKCDEIPLGDEVALHVENAVGTVLFDGYTSVSPGSILLFNPFEYTGNAVDMAVTPMDDSSECASVECEMLFYSTYTCDPRDTCDWSGDGTCDDACLSLVDDMFDEAGDCVAL